MPELLKQAVYEANMELPGRGLVVCTRGNISGIDRESGLAFIKPSGIEYDDLTPEKTVVVDPEGKIVEGGLNPSSATKTHLELYIPTAPMRLPERGQGRTFPATAQPMLTTFTAAFPVPES